MPKVSPEHQERRRQEVLRAALKCFARRGYHETTMDHIVKAAGLSKGALYQYFRTKEDLFLALCRIQQADLRTRLEQAFAESGDVRERLERGAKVFLSSLRGEYRDVLRIGLEFWSEAQRRRELRKESRQTYLAWRAFLAQILAEGVHNGEMRADLDPDATAAVILAFSDGLTLHSLLQQEDVDPEKVMAAFLAATFQGIGATPAPGGSRPRRRADETSPRW
jgi:AcrR family transcriptional regulator